MNSDPNRADASHEDPPTLEPQLRELEDLIDRLVPPIGEGRVAATSIRDQELVYGDGTPFEVASLLRRIRTQYIALRTGIGPTDTTRMPRVPTVGPAPVASPWPETITLPRAPEVSTAAPESAITRADEVLGRHDESFVRAAYLAVLGRDPDPEGMASTLAALYAGDLSKAEIVGHIRESEEGCKFGAHLEGLDASIRMRRWRRIPFFGKVLGIFQYLLRLPTVVRNLERLEIAVFRRDKDLTRSLNYLAAELEGRLLGIQWRQMQALDALAAHVDRMAALASHVEALQEADFERRGNVRGLTEQLADILDSLESIQTRVDASASESNVRVMGETSQTTLSVVLKLLRALDKEKVGRTEVDHAIRQMDQVRADQLLIDAITLELGRRNEDHQRLVAVQETVSQLGDDVQRLSYSVADATGDLQGYIAGPASGGAVKCHARSLEELYAKLEQHFRGPRDIIRDRLSVYLPIIRECIVIDKNAPVLDVGCGRGEWLELLRENGIAGSGIDVNGAFVEECIRLGLDVIEVDALRHLRGLEDGSVGGLTAIHIVEHLPFKDLIEFLRESLRVLASGGIAILETPNPENLNVGAHTFWLDPTHIRPLPPEMLRFVVEVTGFSKVEILRLHPYPEDHRVPDGVGAEQLNMLLYGPRDYAVIARKA